MTDYNAFLAKKSQQDSDGGFVPGNLPDWMYDFQKHLTEWALRKGRAAIFADCGLGKTPMQLVWADNVVRHTNGHVLIITPLAVSHQTEREARKFDIDAKRSVDGSLPSRIVITNYERLHHFTPDSFDGVVCDESSILKNFNGKRKAEINEFMRKTKYRLLCTATAAPNDCWELGTSSEALGYLGFSDMLTRFFKQDTKKDYLGWGRTTYRFRGHAQEPFWRWVCSWARVIRRPSDMGFDDDGFILPPLIENEHIVTTSVTRPGMLFALPAGDLQEQRDERRLTIKERCQAASERINGSISVLWCHLNQEGDLLEKIIPGAVQVSGSMSDEKKEERLLAFQDGEINTLVTKPKIGCFGLNWQHCHNVVTFPSHSWEQYYQCIRRCLRFGQKNPVKVSVISTEGEQRVLANLQRKAKQADMMFESISKYANDALHIERSINATEIETIPDWIGATDGSN